MRDYSKVSPKFWTGETGQKIKRQGKEAIILAMYLMTCPSSNMIGLFYLPPPLIAHETGIDIKKVTHLLSIFEQITFSYYDSDSEYIFIREMARFQIGDHLKPEDKRVAWIQDELSKFKVLRLRQLFFERYQNVYSLAHVRPEIISKRQKISPSLRWKVLQRDKHTCTYCGRSSPGVTLEVDHIIAIANGGKSIESNLSTCCYECNIGKSDKTLGEGLTEDHSITLSEAPISQDQEQIQIQEQDQEKEPPIGGMSPGGDPVSAPPTIQDVLDLWNPIPGAKPVNLDRLTPDRGLHKRITVLTRQHKKDSWEFWRTLFAAVDAQRNFLFSGATSKTGWTADLAWVLGPENMAKVLERRYENFKLPAEVLPNMPGALRAVAGPPQGGCNWHPDGAWCELRVMSRTGNDRRCGWHIHVDRYELPATRDKFEQWVSRANPLLLPKPLPSLDELWAMVTRGVLHGAGSPDR